MSSTKRVLTILIGVVVVGFVLLQLVSFIVPSLARTNPPVTYQVQWDSPEIEQMMRKACYDCHSNETVWPWYSYIAPVSWLIVNHVNEGRDNLNFSTGQGELEAENLIRQIERGHMPPANYLSMHPEANLSESDKVTLIQGIRASFLGN
jgi:cytochrome c551/c552